jgi:membrane-associated phospholipid phosphatase
MKKAITFFLLWALPVLAIAQESDTNGNETVEASAPRPRRDWADVTGPKLYFRPKVDFAIIIPASIWSGYAFTKIYNKPNIDSATVAGLNKDNVPAFDRWAVKHSDAADAASNIPFYASIPYPIVLLADKDIRHDAARVYGLYWEAMAITGLLYTGGDYFIDRYRPETYDETKPFGDRLSGNEKNAFFGGHPALVATSTFFTASVYDIYHPHSAKKWIFYGIAAAATGTTIYLRHVAGKHWPSDLLVGTVVGMGSGMLVPRLHRNKPAKKHAWMVTPTLGEGYGMAATWQF